MAPWSLEIGGWTPTLALATTYVLVTLQIIPLVTPARLLTELQGHHGLPAPSRKTSKAPKDGFVLNDKWLRLSQNPTEPIEALDILSAALNLTKLIHNPEDLAPPWVSSARSRREVPSPNEVPTDLAALVDQLPPLNLTETISQTGNRTDRRPARDSDAIPQYMLDLYSHYARNKRDHPSSNIVRSFANIFPQNGKSF